MELYKINAGDIFVFFFRKYFFLHFVARNPILFELLDTSVLITVSLLYLLNRSRSFPTVGCVILFDHKRL